MCPPHAAADAGRGCPRQSSCTRARCEASSSRSRSALSGSTGHRRRLYGRPVVPPPPRGGRGARCPQPTGGCRRHRRRPDGSRRALRAGCGPTGLASHPWRRCRPIPDDRRGSPSAPGLLARAPHPGSASRARGAERLGGVTRLVHRRCGRSPSPSADARTTCTGPPTASRRSSAGDRRRQRGLGCRMGRHCAGPVR